MMEETLLLCDITKERVDQVVDAVKRRLSDESLRREPQRAVQAKVWHTEPVVSAVLQELRTAETNITNEILSQCSILIYQFHEHALDVTLQRAGIAPKKEEEEVTEEVTNGRKRFALACQEAKERIYMILKEYDWLKDFFRKYPLHFYENSFEFVHRIPLKRLPVQVKIVGLGIGGSMALSGLAKRGIAVTGYEKRCEVGPRSVTSRYQNASWRAYDTAEKMVNPAAYELLVANRQRVHVPQQDGTTKIVSSDRVQIILGSAIQAALDSAREYGANIVLECQDEDIFCSSTDPSSTPTTDIVALFCGAHTLTAFPGLAQELGVMTWPELDSRCRMWLQLRVSDKIDGYCARGGEIGTERWHYTIESARDALLDIDRVQWNQDSQYEFLLKKMDKGQDIGMTREELTTIYNKQRSQLEKVKQAVMAQQEKDNAAIGSRFDYVFTNAPANEHNLAKRQAVDDAVVLDGEYTVEIKITQNASIRSGDLLRKFNTKLVVCGGDACVPPNPLAAYGATLACEAAYSLVLMVVAMGHLNAIEEDMKDVEEFMNGEDWIKQVQTLKRLMYLHYEARARSENYFQFVQTLICNLYSLPPFY